MYRKNITLDRSTREKFIFLPSTNHSCRARVTVAIGNLLLACMLCYRGCWHHGFFIVVAVYVFLECDNSVSVVSRKVGAGDTISSFGRLWIFSTPASMNFCSFSVKLLMSQCLPQYVDPLWETRFSWKNWIFMEASITAVGSSSSDLQVSHTEQSNDSQSMMETLGISNKPTDVGRLQSSSKGL